MLVTKTWSATAVDGDQYPKELHHMGVLDNSRNSTRILISDTNKAIRPRATPIKRFSSGMAKCLTPCRPISTLRLPRGAGQAFAGRAGGFREDAAGESCGARREAAGEGGIRSEGPGHVLTDLHEKPGQLRDILGDGSGSQPQGQAPGSNPIVDMLSSPLAKAVLAGIAAIVVKRMMGSSQTT